MKTKIFFILLNLLIVVSCTTSIDNTHLTPVQRQIQGAEWSATAISDGVIWKYFHFDTIFSSKQYITVFDINLNKGIRVDIPYAPEGFMKTSSAAISANATVAINGSYFDTTVGGSTVFFRKNGEIIHDTRPTERNYRENAGFSINKSGKVSILKRPSDDAGGWASIDARHLLTSGPLLIYNGDLIQPVDDPFNTNRHPRTAVGITKDNRLICMVVDGRSSQSHGMSIAEVTEVMHALGCVTAMNLDGGGSSTAWVKGQGVANHPSDNKLFDHEGERVVANAITITKE